MILGNDRPAVVEHIRQLVSDNELNAKAELDDPVLTPEQKGAGAGRPAGALHHQILYEAGQPPDPNRGIRQN